MARALEFYLSLDTSDAEKQLQDFAKTAEKAASSAAKAAAAANKSASGSNSKKTDDDKAAEKAIKDLETRKKKTEELNARFKQTEEIIKKISAEDGLSEHLIKAKNEQAGLISGLKKLATTEEELLQLYRKETEVKQGARESQKELNDLNNKRKALSDINSKYATLEQVAKKLENMKGMSAELSKVKGEQASLIANMRKYAESEEEIISLLAKENDLRKQSNEHAKTASKKEGGSGWFSAHSERQKEILDGMNRGGGLPGMDMLGKFGGGGGAAGAAAAAATMVIAKAVEGLQELGKAARETAQKFGDAGGKLDKLRESEERLNQQKSVGATSKGAVGFEQLKLNIENWWQGNVNKFADYLGKAGEAVNDFGTLITKGADAVSKQQQDREKEEQNAKLGKVELRGETKKSADALEREQGEMERDIFRERQQFEHDIATQRRDYVLDVQQTEMQAARSKMDLEKQARRENEDYEHEKQKLEEDFEGKQAEKKYQYDRERARREFATKQADALADFTLKQGYAKQDFATKQADARKDFSTKAGDKAEDFERSKSEKSEDFGIEQRRANRDYSDKLFDMRMGGASALSYLQAARDFNKQQADKAEDFAKEQRRSQKTYDTETKREKRDFETTQSREERDFGISQERGQTEFDIKTDREKRDFANQEKDAAFARQMEIEAHLYQLKEQSYQLEKNHQRAVEDTSEAMKRLAQDTDLARERLANKKSDMDYAEQIGRENMDISETSRRRGMSESIGNFLNQMYDNGKNADQFTKYMRDNPKYQGEWNKERERGGYSKWDFDQTFEQNGYVKKASAPGSTSSGGSFQGAPGSDKGWGGAAGSNAQGTYTLPYTSASGVSRDVWAQMNDVQRRQTLRDRGIKGYATGGLIAQQQIAELHPGEYVINPNSPDRGRQNSLLQGALTDMGYDPTAMVKNAGEAVTSNGGSGGGGIVGGFVSGSGGGSGVLSIIKPGTPNPNPKPNPSPIPTNPDPNSPFKVQFQSAMNRSNNGQGGFGASGSGFGAGGSGSQTVSINLGGMNISGGGLPNAEGLFKDVVLKHTGALKDEIMQTLKNTNESNLNTILRILDTRS